ncbi:MAG: hypothetical protein M0P72_12745, partial [Metallibacterium scheffleri]|uniref:hypothetical protein n=1 Tax=Metallibacterium scheffleri TaxID=993689 RepID=UPI0026EE949A
MSLAHGNLLGEHGHDARIGRWDFAGTEFVPCHAAAIHESVKLCRHPANLIQIKTGARRPRQTAAMTLHAPQAPRFDAELIRRYDV